MGDDDLDLGRVAYEIYGNTRSWTTATGGLMPWWANQSDELKEAWRAAARGVVDAYRVANVVIEVHEGQGARRDG